jgi:hypothetical protein
MRGRIRIAAMGVAAVAITGALTASAGAATTALTWNLKANGGFVSLSVLNDVQVSGGGSDAEAASSDMAEALGTGACVSSAATSNPCPTSPGNVSSFALDSSQFAVQGGSDGSALPSPPGSSNCAVPAVKATPLLSLGPACGSATASEDAKGNPTAEGTGSLIGAQALTLSLNSLLRSGIGGLSLPSASNLCSSIPAATPTAGPGPTSLPAPVSTLLTTANGLLSGVTGGTPLATTSVDSRSPLDGACSIVGGLVNELGDSSAAALLTDLTSGAGTSGLPPLLSIAAGGSVSKVTTAANGGTLTARATQEAVDLNVLGMLDIQVTPTTSSVSLDTATGQVTPTCNAGVVKVRAAGQALPLSQLNALGSTIEEVLTQLGATPLGTVIDQLLNFKPDGVLSCTPGTTAGGTSGTATADSVDLNLAPAVNLLSLDLGNVDASVSPAATSGVATSPSETQGPPPAVVSAPPVPNVTSVHTGEYWAGPLPIVLMTGMGLAGLALIGRRRVAAAARSLHPISRLRGGQ